MASKLVLVPYSCCVWVFLLTLVGFPPPFVKSSPSDHRYNVGDEVPLFVNKVGPLNNPRLVPHYFFVFVEFWSNTPCLTMIQVGICISCIYLVVVIVWQWDIPILWLAFLHSRLGYMPIDSLLALLHLLLTWQPIGG